MRPIRWLPLPTCRLPLRRFIASLTIVALVLPMFGLEHARADAGASNATGGTQAASTPDGSFCSGFSYPAGANAKASDQKKYKDWVADYEKVSTEHRKGSPDVAFDSIQAVLEQGQVKAELRIPAMVELHKNYKNSVAEFADKLCPPILNFSHDVNTVKLTVEKAKEKQTNDTCKFDDAQRINDGSTARLAQIDHVYNEVNDVLTRMYQKWAHHNKEAIDNEGKADDRVPGPSQRQAMTRYTVLSREFKSLWGDESEIKAAAEGKLTEREVKSVFGTMLKSIHVQKVRLTSQVSQLKSYGGQLKELNDKCGSALRTFLKPGEEKGKLSGLPDPNKNTQYDADGKTLICKPGTSAVMENGAMNPTRCDTVAALTTGGTQQGGDQSGAGNGVGGGVGGDLTGGEQRRPVTPPPAPTEEESWISKNKGTLIIGGVGVAAVAGALLWKKSEDDKAKKDARYMEMEAAMAVQAQQQQSSGGSSSDGGSSGDSTAGGGGSANQTPVGSTLMIEGTPSGSVGTGTTLPPLTIKVVDPQGIMTTDSATDITVSCATATPAPCTLSGTLTVNTDQGKAVFSNLKFTGAHTNVTLLFSAGGFAPVKSGNFDVSGRQ